MVFPEVSDHSSLKPGPISSEEGPLNSPETRSGGLPHSNGNKGVYFPPFSHQSIYTLFFGQIINQADSGFPSSFSGSFARLINIKQARMAIPVAPETAMEIKGSPIRSFLILLYILSSGSKFL
jgi:hypothetical protein